MSIRSRITLVLVTALFLAISTYLMADGPTASLVRAGQWETTTTIEMTGMPMQLPPITTTTCISKEDARDPDKSLPRPGKGDCKFTDYKVDGNKVSWNLKCTGEHGLSGSGDLLFKGDAYDGTIKMTMDKTDSQVHEMIMHVKAKRTGDCSK